MGSAALDLSFWAPADWAAVWSRSAFRLSPFTHETSASNGCNFEVSLALRDVGEVSIYVIKGSAHRVDARPTGVRRLTLLVPKTAGGWIEMDGHPFELLPNRGYLLYPDRAFGFCLPTDFVHWNVILPADRCAATWLPARRHALSGVSLSGAGVLFGSLLAEAFEHAKKLTQAAAAAASRSLVDLLNAALIDSPSLDNGGASRLQSFHRRRIREYALLRLHEHYLSLKSIAAGVGLSPRHVTHLFSQEEQPLMQWVWSERLRRARDQLATIGHERRRIADVAFACGFADPAHFTRSFKLKFGVSPSVYTKQTKEA
jgi:AraC-like DNA-binding protein